MIDVADLTSAPHLPGNYFSPHLYVQSDLELGILENRRGERLLAVPDSLIRGLYIALDEETGKAARLVLFNCGCWWGKNLYARFCDEVTDYYHKAVADMEMIEFLQCLQQFWETHGWGKLALDRSYYRQGFLLMDIWNSPFVEQAPNWKRPVCFVEAGILQAFFQQLTGRDLHCLQIACESQGAECNRFILGLSERLQAVEAWVDEGLDAETIMTRLCEPQTLNGSR